MYLNNSYKLLVILLIASYDEVVPKTCENFKQLATKGIDGKTYVGTKFHTAIERIMIQGGDIVNNDGSGSISIYGKYFDDENFTIKPDSSGLLVMANNGPNTNGCQFFAITLPTPWLEGKNVVFGKVLKGAEIIHTIEHLKTDVNDRILKSVIIAKSVLPLEIVPFDEITCKNKIDRLLVIVTVIHKLLEVPQLTALTGQNEASAVYELVK
ncbi:hypothetical protein NQ314_004764 [Rhamnusium bicolor]|uniref:Peptidyl-prolyl cis-trans isomerase n=1 Tax=Rhamnusium bicolor TaxID=1586634 RepID=A0AAV8ZJT9_9CUCU|nr:hypothetical protein NQ314_004764 [Rhamnusium bicolor]